MPLTIEVDELIARFHRMGRGARRRRGGLARGLPRARRGGLELGVTTPEWTRTHPLDPGTARLVRDGFRVLHDPHGALGELAPAGRS